MNEIARRAGVGIATLGRRFPTREDLITATFAAKMKAYVEAIDDALQDLDPWRGFAVTSKGSARCKPLTAASPTCSP
jgi:AcrR family transcriptional regulator